MSQLYAVDSVTGARDRVGNVLRDSHRRVSYQILDVIGYGTYGCIYLARPLTGAPEFKAIKCLSKKGLSPTQLLLQRQEIDIHLSVSSARDGHHPHIVDMASVIETSDSLYLVMEYCSGGDLYDAITSQHSAAGDSGVDLGPTRVLSGRHLNVHSDGSVLDAMAQILSALAHAHSLQVFHRDLKPENILVAGDGSLKLADFGLATRERVSSDFGCGSSFYMAPEQQPILASAGRRPYLPAKSDVWALGIIFLNLRFGRNPWKLSRADMDETFAAYAQDPNVLKGMFPELSPSALYFLQRVLCVDPNERADCYEALELVQRIDCVVCDQVDPKSYTFMEDCEQERVSSYLHVDDSTSFSSSCSSSSAYSSQSSTGDSTSRSLYEQNDVSNDKVSLSRSEGLLEPLFLMDDESRSRLPSSGKVRTNSCSSGWSLASSLQSGKSWSDMIEEEEMDFTLPVEFEELGSTKGSTMDPPMTAPAIVLDTSSNNSSDSDLESSNNSLCRSADSPCTTTTTSTTTSTTFDDSFNDSFLCYDQPTNHHATFDLDLVHLGDSIPASPSPLLMAPPPSPRSRPASPAFASPTGRRQQLDSTWSWSSSWLHEDLALDFARARFSKFSDYVLSSGSRSMCSTPTGLISLGSAFLSNPP